MNVESLATTQVIGVRPDASLLAAGRLIQEHAIRHLPVVDGAGHLVGIVTDRDIKRASASEATSLDIHELLYLVERIEVQRVMTADPVTVSPGDPVQEAARPMVERKIGCVPVVNGSKPVGILTEIDLLKLVARGA